MTTENKSSKGHGLHIMRSPVKAAPAKDESVLPESAAQGGPEQSADEDDLELLAPYLDEFDLRDLRTRNALRKMPSPDVNS
jgi:hypothetical protein